MRLAGPRRGRSCRGIPALARRRLVRGLQALAAAGSRRVGWSTVVPGWPCWALPRPAPRRAEERRFLAGGLDVVGRGAQDWFHAGSHRAELCKATGGRCVRKCVADVQFKGRGVGLNVDNEKPTTCLNAALQEANPTSPILKREDILAYFLSQGFQALEEQNSWLHSGQRVVVQDAHETKSGSVVTI